MFQKWTDQDKYKHFVLKSNQEKHKELKESQVYVENKDEAMDNISNRTPKVQCSWMETQRVCQKEMRDVVWVWAYG